MSDTNKEVLPSVQKADEGGSKAQNTTSAPRCAFCGLMHSSKMCKHAHVFGNDVNDSEVDFELRTIAYLRGAAEYLESVKEHFPEMQVSMEVDEKGVLIKVRRPFFRTQPIYHNVHTVWSMFRAESANPLIRVLDALVPKITRDI